MKKIVFIFIVSLLLFSCGYKSAEGDKHPDIPLFPAHTNTNVKISRLPVNNEGLGFKNINNIFYFSSYRGCVITSSKFKIVDSLQHSATSSYYINENGTIYNLTFNPKESLDTLDLNDSYSIQKAIKTTPPLFQEEQIETKQILVASWDARDTVIQYVKKLNNNLDCIIEVNKYTCLLVLQNKEIILQSNLPLPEKIFEYKNCESLYFNTDFIVPKSFDKTILGNKSSGNHFAFGFRQYGYNYIELTIGNQSTKTKVENFGTSNGLEIIHQNKTKDTLIVKLDKEDKLYYLTLKNKV